MNLRPPSIAVGLSPIIRRDLRHAVQVNRTSACLISAFDWRRMVRHARTLRTTPSLNSCFRTEVRIQFRRSRHRQSPSSSRIFGKTTFDRQPQNPLWLAPCAGLRFSCRDRQNAFAICPSCPLFRVAARAIHCGTAWCIAITVSSTIATCSRLTPATPATWL